MSKTADPVFFIRHFAGTVMYNIDGFLEKNRDTFHTDSISLVGGSSNKFLVYLFAKDLKESRNNQNP